MSVKQRIIEFIKYKKISQSAFEKSVGLSNGYVNNIKNSIQPDKLQKISLSFPDVSTGWLMTGEGAMLKTDSPAPLREASAESGTDRLLAIIESQQRIIESLQKTIASLTHDSRKE